MKILKRRDWSMLWSPITVISLTYLYYCAVPFFLGVQKKYAFNEMNYNSYLFHFAALLSYVAILLSFSVKTKTNFKRWNKVFTHSNSGKIGICIFIISLVFYVPFRGFHLFFIGDGAEQVLINGGLIYYFISMIDMFSVAAALMLVGYKHNRNILYYIFPLWVILMTFVFAGARWRLVILLFSFLSVFHLYPVVRKPKFIVLIPLAIVTYLGFSVMDSARSYSRGLDMGILKSLNYRDIKGGAQENSDVYTFSIQCMDMLEKTGERVYFQPLSTALLMPIPRSLFPNKPDNRYLTVLEDRILGNSNGGAAMLFFVEAYYAFGWIGIILMGVIIGILGRKFWDNYLNNPHSIGAVVLLGIFSALCYSIISRGYLASTVTNFMLVMVIPFWLSTLFAKVFRIFQK